MGSSHGQVKLDEQIFCGEAGNANFKVFGLT
jgi:hypothetical protein